MMEPLYEHRAVLKEYLFFWKFTKVELECSETFSITNTSSSSYRTGNHLLNYLFAN